MKDLPSITRNECMNVDIVEMSFFYFVIEDLSIIKIFRRG